MSAAIIVSVGPRDGGQSYETAIRPCGGRLDLIVGREIPTGDDWLVFLSYDSSRAFDAALAGWTGDPHDLPGKYTVLPIWSRGDIRVADLPKWVTVTPDDTQIGTTPAAGTVVPPCGPLPTTPAGTIPLTVGFAE
ncbi:MAG: hypothetical protein HY263_12220 [Chloroflexi bacterium]|nr:hypothetical protein [Chloroflexota bacterium]